MNRKTVKHHFSFVCSPLFQLLRAWTQAFFNFPSRFKLSNLTEVLRHHFLTLCREIVLNYNFFTKWHLLSSKKTKPPYDNSDCQKTQKPNSYQVLLSTFRTTRIPWSNDDCLGQYPCLFNYDQLDVFWLGLIDYLF